MTLTFKKLLREMKKSMSHSDLKIRGWLKINTSSICSLPDCLICLLVWIYVRSCIQKLKKCFAVMLTQ